MEVSFVKSTSIIGNGRWDDVSVPPNKQLRYQIQHVTFSEEYKVAGQIFRDAVSSFVEGRSKVGAFLKLVVAKIEKGEGNYEKDLLELIKEFKEKQSYFSWFSTKIFAQALDEDSLKLLESPEFLEGVSSLSKFEKMYSTLRKQVMESLKPEMKFVSQTAKEKILEFIEPTVEQVRDEAGIGIDWVTREILDLSLEGTNYVYPTLPETNRAYNVFPLTSQGAAYSAKTIENLSKMFRKNELANLSPQEKAKKPMFRHPFTRELVTASELAYDVYLDSLMIQLQALQALALLYQRNKPVVVEYLTELQKVAKEKGAEGEVKEIQEAIDSGEDVPEETKKLFLETIQFIMKWNRKTGNELLKKLFAKMRETYSLDTVDDTYVLFTEQKFTQSPENVNTSFPEQVQKDISRRVLVDMLLQYYWPYVDKDLYEAFKEFSTRYGVNINQPLGWNFLDFEAKFEQKKLNESSDI